MIEIDRLLGKRYKFGDGSIWQIQSIDMHGFVTMVAPAPSSDVHSCIVIQMDKLVPAIAFGFVEEV